MVGKDVEAVVSDDPLPAISRIDPEFTATAEQFLQNGFHPIICRNHGREIGYVWWHDKEVKEPHPCLDRLGICLNDKDVYFFNMYVAPEFREAGVAGAFFADLMHKMRDRGYVRAFGFVAYNNVPARWMYTAHGWKTLLRFRGIVIGNTVLVSKWALFLNSDVLGHINKRWSRIVSEFVPIGSILGRHSETS